ncbi:MAG: DUF559 domain-containing protein [Xanthobacteraceae bacterium]|nr:DUF559 domain-containing protein [Xanthobacteraceae bacterium]
MYDRTNAGAGLETTVSTDAIATFVLGAKLGSVLALEGTDGATLRARIDEIDPDQCDKRVLFVPIKSAATAAAIIGQIIDLLAETTHRLWPLWFTDISFHECRNDTLGQQAVVVIAQNAARDIAGLSSRWAASAARLQLEGLLPRVAGATAAIELSQLALTISRSGLILLVDVTAAIEACANAAIVVHALEWVAHHANAAVVALFAQLPPGEAPYDRILYGARAVSPDASARTWIADAGGSRVEENGPWLAPWRGTPHPLSVVEQRLHAALVADDEIGSLFHFNLSVETVRGSRPRVDLVWPEGRLVVELDGYGSHGNRSAFIADRHRDYELTLSGYTVLRLANDEIAHDFEKAIEKIRDLVHWRRTYMKLGA